MEAHMRLSPSLCLLTGIPLSSAIYLLVTHATIYISSIAWFGVLVPMMRKLQTTFSRSKGVKQGHFVVIATQGWKPERFFIELGYLDHPDFVKLLKQAEEEFGFSQVGALAIPCEPDDLKRIIGRKKNRNEGITCWVKGIRVA